MGADDIKKKRVAPVGFVAMPLVSLFLLVCIHQKVLDDIDALKWQSLAVRVGFVILVGFLFAWRLERARHLQLNSLRSIRDLAVCTLFLAVLCYPLFSQYFYFKKSIGDVARAITVEQPDGPRKMFALLRHFPTQYKKFSDTHLQLPKEFIHLNAMVKVFGLGVSPNTKVAVGKNGFYFEGWGARRVEKGVIENFDNIADYMGQIPFSSDELRRWKQVLEERKYWLKAQGIEYVFVLAPTKALVYPEYLPSNLQKVEKGTTRYDQLSGYLKESADIRFIDLRPPLHAAKERRDYPLLFYKTDFHWNFYGAFIAYQAIISDLKTMFPKYHLTTPRLSEFELVIDENWAHSRFMDMIGLPDLHHKTEHYITMVPKPGGRYDSARDLPPAGISDVYPPERPIEAENGHSKNFRLILNPKAPIPSLLLLGDSFMEKCVYFFSADARRVINYRTVVNFPDTILRYEKPDIVIQEILNMFILRPPPKNPAGFTPYYLKGKFADNSDHIVTRQHHDDFVGTSTVHDNAYIIRPHDTPYATNTEVRIARISFAREQKGEITIRLVTKTGNEIVQAGEALAVEPHHVYFDLPPEPIETITVSPSEAHLSAPIPESLEIRSDLSR